jgi:hypothetical protein
MRPMIADQRQEKACAAICFAVVVPFTLLVLIEGSVATTEFLRLAAEFIGIALLLTGCAFIPFAGVELVKSGLRSGWKERPALALLSALKERWRVDRLFCLIWPIALFLVLLPSFNAFKQRILPQAGFKFDPALAELDRALFGTDPGLLLHSLIGSPWTTNFFDALYHSWFVPTTLGLCVVGLCAGTRLRAQYMLSYVGVWLILGAFAAYLLPAAGPAFYAALVGPDGAGPFLAVHEQLAMAGQTRFLTSLGNQAYLLENLNAPTLVIGGGISAIPSVHNGMAVLFALVSFRFHWTLGVATSLFAFLIWIASVYLNWHYAVDGIAGAVGAVLIWHACGKIVDRLLTLVEARRTDPSAGPVLVG